MIICSCGLPRRRLRVGEASMGMASGMEVGAAVCTDSTVAAGGDVVSAGGRAWGGRAWGGRAWGGRAWGGTRGSVAEASAAAGLGRAVRAGAMDGGRNGSGVAALWCSQNACSLNAESKSVDTAGLASHAGLLPPAGATCVGRQECAGAVAVQTQS
jgi:hypothetical protein